MPSRCWSLSSLRWARRMSPRFVSSSGYSYVFKNQHRCETVDSQQHSDGDSPSRSCITIEQIHGSSAKAVDQQYQIGLDGPNLATNLVAIRGFFPPVQHGGFRSPYKKMQSERRHIGKHSIAFSSFRKFAGVPLNDILNNNNAICPLMLRVISDVFKWLGVI